MKSQWTEYIIKALLDDIEILLIYDHSILNTILDYLTNFDPRYRPLSYVVNLIMDRYVRNPSLSKIISEIIEIEDLENINLWQKWLMNQESKGINFNAWSLKVDEAVKNNIDYPSILSVWFDEA